MKVIFLDIDGVLNTPATPKPTKESRVVDSVLVERLNKLLQQTSAAAVLTSTWRHEPGGVETARELGVRFTDIVPDLRPRPRNEEIVAWLSAHPEAKRYVVIDDDDDCLDEFPLFQPSASEGLTTRMTEAAVAYLNGQSDSDMRKNVVVRFFQRMLARLQDHHG